VLFIIAYIIVFAIIGGVTGATLINLADPSAGPPLMFLIVMTLIGAVVSMIGTVGAAAIYFELREIKEGVGATELAKVFS
jgi:RsiW-degrading membrane proteinase PrsW (M82 family)